MKPKTEQLITTNISNLKINEPTEKIESMNDNNSVNDHKLIKNSSSKPWSIGSLMGDITLSPTSSYNSKDSPARPCDSCRPSTVFYSPRFQEMRNSSTFSNQNLKNQKLMRTYESTSKNNGFLEAKNSNAPPYASSIVFDTDCHKGLYTIHSTVPSTVHEEGSIHKKGTSTAKTDEFGVAVPVIGGSRHLKPYQEFLGDVENQIERSEPDAMRKAAYTRMLMKLTKKEETIDEWESKRRTKATLQLQKLEKKLDQKRAEAVQKVHKKLTETKLEAQKRKAKARRSALKEMAKHCSALD